MRQKNFFSFLLTLALTVFMPIHADELLVNDGTTTNEYIPFYGYYADTQGQHSQFVLPAESLADLSDGKITQLKFFCTSASDATDWNASTYAVRLTEIEENNLSASFADVSAAQTVFTGILSFTGAELIITCTESYTYNGGNLLVDFQCTTSAGYKRLSFYGVSAETAVARYNSGSGSGSGQSFLPKVEFTYEPGTPATCQRPEAPVVSEITTESAVITWGAAEGVSTYQIALVAAGEELVWEEQGVLVEGLSRLFESLTSNTAYDCYVRSYCSAEDQSSTRKVSFRTACGVLDLPWSENFDNISSGKLTLNCWSNEQTAGSDNKYASVSSNNTLSFPYTSAGGKIRVITPAMNVPTAGEYEFSLSAQRTKGGAYDGEDYYAEGVRIFALTSDDQEVEIGFVPKSADSDQGVGAVESAGWYSYQFTIPVSGIINIIIQWESNDGLGFNIDNFSTRKIPNCFPPSNLHMSEATLNSISLAWAPYSEDNLNAHIVIMDGENEIANAIINDSVYTIEGLEHSRYYNFNVTIHTVCGEEESVDALSASLSLSTLCAPISTIPWAENFESTPDGILPLCWTTEEGAHYPYIYYSPYTSLEGEKLLNFYGGSTYYGDEYVALPELGAELDINTLELSFLYKQTTTGDAYPQLIVGVMSDPADLGTFLPVQALEQTESVTEAEVDFANVPATHKYIAIKVPVVGSSTTFYVDDVKLVPQPTCIKPVNIALDEIAETTVTLTWEGVSEQYELTLVHADLDAEEYAEIIETHIVSGNSYTLENLVPVRNYGVVAGIRAICAEGDTSKIATSATFTFRTAIPASYAEVLSLEHDEFAVDFANEEEAKKWIILYGSGSNNLVIGEGAKEEMGVNALYVSNDGSTYAYTNNSSSASAACRLFEIPAADSVKIEFDWLANGESGYDYGRVAIMPADIDENTLFASTMPTSVFILADKLQAKTTVQHFAIVVEDIPAGQYKLVFGWKNDTSGGSQKPLAVANVNVKLYAENELSCKKVSDIHVTEVLADRALVEWKPGKDEANWNVEILNKNAESEWASLTAVEVEDTLFWIENLEYATSYELKVVVTSSCGEGRYAKPAEAIVSFTTDIPADAVTIINKENPAYTADFNTNWFIMAGTGANNFVIGNKAEDALLNGAETALYVANDENGTYAYTNTSSSATVAYHRFDLEVAADTLIVNFDWLANGESTWDYGRAFIIPATMEVTINRSNYLLLDGQQVAPENNYTSVCPVGAIDLGNGKLNLQTAAQHLQDTLTNIPAGQYKLIFGWGNDGSSGSDKPLSICNLNMEMHQMPVYTLNYVVEGQLVETVQYHAGDVVIATELVPVKEGYTFTGWNDLPATMPENDITVTGGFTINSYDLAIVVNGEALPTQTLVYGTPLAPLAAAMAAQVPEGYEIISISEYPETMPANNLTVTVILAPKFYALTYVVDGEVVGTDSIAYGSNIIAREEPTKVGYTFSGWNEIPETMPNNDVTVTGTFTINQYTVTVIAENGTVEGAGTYNYGTEVTLTATAAEGYEFKGWADENTDNPRTIVVNENVTLTAVFEEIPVVGLDNIGINGLQVINRTIIANETIRIYTIIGQDVTETNGNLANGVYVVKGETMTVKVSIR